MKRVGALIGAVVMVAAALAIRGTSGGDEGDDGGPAADGGSLLCPEELADICDDVDALDPRPLGDIVDELVAVGDTAELDATTWIVPRAWADLVIAERARQGSESEFTIDSEVVASTEVVLAIWADEAEALSQKCPGVGWVCLADQVAAGDRVNVGMPEVDTVGGLSVAAAQAGAVLGTSDYAANDFDGSFDTAAARLATGQRSEPLNAMRARGPGELTAVGTLGSDATNVRSNFGEIVLVDGGGPEVRVDLVVLSTSGGGLNNDDRDRLVAALRDAGWDEPGTGPDGLPTGGVLAAIRTLWNENR